METPFLYFIGPKSESKSVNPLWTNLTSAVNTNGVIFNWDVRKATANLKKHGIDFREAATIFADPLSTTFPDQDHSEFEHRFLTVGQSIRGRILVVAHTEENDTIRIISAREATRREQSFYEENESE
jgi:uncharacterized DUF497 family protein